jgi:signal transduction histidine kinase
MTPTERFSIPGGLRMQLLVGLAILLAGTIGLVVMVVIPLTERQAVSSQRDVTLAAAQQLKAQLDGADTRELDALNLPEGVHAVAWRSDDTSQDLPNTSVVRGGDGGPRVIAAVATQRGTLEVATSLSPVYAQVRRTRDLLLVYLGLDALFILIVGYGLLTFVVVRPVLAIEVATQRAARGDLASHIEVTPSNELGQVARSFNQMLDELRENRRALKTRLDELDRAYEELETTQQSLIRSEKMAGVGQLAAGIAHEVGNPLSAIAGYAELLADSDLTEQERRDLGERIVSQTTRIQGIIRDLLDYSRQEEREPLAAVDLEHCIDEALDLVDPQPRLRGIQIDADTAPSTPKVRGNADQIVQTIVNLILNAADAIRSQHEAPDNADALGKIEIAARPAADGGALLEIHDDGPGIPPSKLDKVFEPFFTTKEPGEGTGLGLAIVERIMRRFDGDVEVESQFGEGTTFRLTFAPAQESGAEDNAEPPVGN